ncbi:MAG: TetR/AcrR family transcriptional regulator [Clostridia bacterium]|nr:TetR/AcrR family transcriptional regulator [Clostridia bacterium]
MGKAPTRIPKKTNSIDKKNRILDAGYYLVCENGYESLTTPQIANKAEVSVGTLYAYFSDKKAVMLEALEIFSKPILFPIYEIIEKTEIKDNNIEPAIKKFLKTTYDFRKMTRRSYENIIGMIHSDEDFLKIYVEMEQQYNKDIVEWFEKNGISKENLNEKVFIINKLINSYADVSTYNSNADIDIDKLSNSIIEIINSLF